MRTIKAPKVETKEVEVTCHNCRAIMGCHREDLRVSSDERDGNVYIMNCPHCGTDTCVNRTLVDGEINS